jgi:hypothetical protein
VSSANVLRMVLAEFLNVESCDSWRIAVLWRVENVSDLLRLCVSVWQVNRFVCFMELLNHWTRKPLSFERRGLHFTYWQKDRHARRWDVGCWEKFHRDSFHFAVTQAAITRSESLFICQYWTI